MDNFVLVDSIISELRLVLLANFPWLDAAFGRSQRLVKKLPSGKVITVPCIYYGEKEGRGPNDYIEVSPDSRIGNFCFFEVDDPEKVSWVPRQRMEIKTPFSIIFWFDLRKIYGELDNRNINYIKNEILTLLNGRTGLTLHSTGYIAINRIYERAENIYRGYSLSEIDNQFLMHPYAGLRFDGIMTVTQPCGDEGHMVRLYNTSDADVTPSDVLEGIVAYGSSGRIIGTHEGDIAGPIYSLDNYVLDGTQSKVIDTGLKLLSGTDFPNGFLLCASLNLGSSYANTMCYLRCRTASSPYKGFKVYMSSATALQIQWDSQQTVSSNQLTGSVYVLIVRSAAFCQWNIKALTKQAASVNDADSSLLIGGEKDADGEWIVGRFGVGTIESLRVYKL